MKCITGRQRERENWRELSNLFHIAIFVWRNDLFPISISIRVQLLIHVSHSSPSPIYVATNRVAQLRDKSTEMYFRLLHWEMTFLIMFLLVVQVTITYRNKKKINTERQFRLSIANSNELQRKVLHAWSYDEKERELACNIQMMLWIGRSFMLKWDYVVGIQLFIS